MARRIEEHSPPIWCRLFGGSRRPEAYSLSLRLVEIIHGKVKMHLLGRMTARPRRGVVVLDLHSGKPSPIGLHCDESVAREGNLSAEELGPELPEGAWRRAVERYGSQASDGHGRDDSSLAWSCPLRDPHPV